jgi:hypothetical protein
MKLSHKKFDKLFARLSRLCWTLTLCLSLHVLLYAVAMNASPLDVLRTEAAAAGMTEAVILCGAMILLGNITYELVKKYVKEG